MRIARQELCARGALADDDGWWRNGCMPRTARRKSVEATHKVRAWRKYRGLSLETLSAAISMSHQNLGKIERGLVPLGEEHHAPLATALGIEPADLFREPGDAPSERLVPVIGRVGADTEGTVLFATADETGELVPVPPGGTDKAAALWVIGHSMGEWAPDGSLLFFENQHTPPTPEMLGEVVVVATDDDRVLVKRLLRGSRPGRYDLESVVGPKLRDVRVRWAAEITMRASPRLARRIVRHVSESQAA